MHPEAPTSASSATVVATYLRDVRVDTDATPKNSRPRPRTNQTRLQQRNRRAGPAARPPDGSVDKARVMVRNGRIRAWRRGSRVGRRTRSASTSGLRSTAIEQAEASRRPPVLGGAAAGRRQDAGRAGDRAAARPHHRRARAEHRDPVAVAARLGRRSPAVSPAQRHARGRGGLHGADLPVAGHLRGPTTRSTRTAGRRRARCSTGCTPTAARSSSGSRQVGDLTLVLDECHHLLEVWGRLLQEVLDELPDAFVLGLTATPPSTLTRDQKALVDELFGDSVFSVSIPAVVREGDLAPFAELAWLTTPTPDRERLAGRAGRAVRRADHGADRPGVRLDVVLRLAGPPVRADAASDDPEQDAALRMVHAGLLALPDGARLTERHRHDPDRRRLGAAARGLGRAPAHAPAATTTIVERIRAVLPSVGYQLTRRGIRRGRSPVDRVLARSEAKTVALDRDRRRPSTATSATRMRMLVLCDHERATATLPADLDGVLSPAGRLGAARARAPRRTRCRDLHPLLVTGRTVAGVARRRCRPLREYVATYDPDLAARRRPAAGPLDQPRLGAVGDPVLRGGPLPACWSAPAACSARAGTPGRSPGWSTSPPRPPAPPSCRPAGRALRTDPYWPEKVALTWSVVCVSEDHPKGGNDWDRFVRKHEGFYGVDAEGDVVAGVAHVDADLLAVRAAAGRRLRRASTPGCWCAPSSARRSATPGRSARRTSTRSCTPSGSLPQHADARR